MSTQKTQLKRDPKVFWYFSGGCYTTEWYNKDKFSPVGRKLPMHMDHIWYPNNYSVFCPQNVSYVLNNHNICYQPMDIIFTNCIGKETLVDRITYRVFNTNPYSYNPDNYNNQIGMRISIVCQKVYLDSFTCDNNLTEYKVAKYEDISKTKPFECHQNIDISNYVFNQIKVDRLTNSNEAILIGFRYENQAANGVSLEDINGRIEIIPTYQEYISPNHTS